MSDSEDLAVLSDMYQIRRKIITSNGPDDENVAVNWIYPDLDLKTFAELKNVELNDMVLLHANESHFNLVVSKNSDLAVLGSLSFRFNVGPIIAARVDHSKENKEEGSITNEEAANDIELKDVLKEVKKALQKSKERNSIIEEQYIQCEKELRKKTEEAEMLRSELKDLKQFIQLEQGLKQTQSDSSKDDNVGEKSVRFNNIDQRSNLPKKKTHADVHPMYIEEDADQEYNCEECAFQGTSETVLNKHIQLKHRLQNGIKCRNCSKTFQNKPDLMIHRKNEHYDSIAPCRKKSGL